MRYFWSKLSRPIRSLLLFALIFGTAFLVLLYYLGYYDFSFLDRYKDELDLLRDGEHLSSGSDDPFAVPEALLMNPAAEPDGNTPAENEASSGRDSAANPQNTSGPASPVSGNGGEKKAPVNLRYVYDTAELPDARIKVSTAAELLNAGRSYASPTVVYAPGKNVLGKLTFDFQFPESYSETWRHATSYRLMPTDPANEDSELVTKPYTFIQQRPTVELYMGYLLIENGDRIVVVSAEGELLCSYATGRYEPAYARDREDRPLFCRTRNNGSLLYFHLSADGKNFVLSDYNPDLDGRGLSFDYPADYGHTDTDRVYVDKDEETGLYGYRIPVEYMPEPEPEPEPAVEPAEDGEAAEAEGESEPAADAPDSESAPSEKPEAEGEPEPEPQPGYLTPYQYRTALPFIGGAAVVTAAEPLPTTHYVNMELNGAPLFPYYDRDTHQTYHEEGWFINNSGIDRSVLCFIGEDGEPLFPTGWMYANEQNRRVFASFQPPYTYGIESLGSFYFDHGLVRVRKQIIDFWRYFLRTGYTGSQIKVVDEYDALIRKDGTEFELPVGYSLEGYSEGRLLLSRDGKYGVQSVTGEWIAQPIFADGGPFVGGLAPLKTEDGRWGLIDTDGNIVLPFTYDSISQVSSGLIACWREENGWSILRIMQ